jgi:hypothetical protein
MLFRSRKTGSKKDFAKKFQDSNLAQNKQLSKELYMSISQNARRNPNLCHIGSCMDFIHFVQSNMMRANMNLLITDSSLFMYGKLKNELSTLGYNLTIITDGIQRIVEVLNQPKQAVFVCIKDEAILSDFYTQWLKEIEDTNNRFSTPLLFIPGIHIPHVHKNMLRARQHNIHFTFHGEDLDAIQRLYPDYDALLAQCDTVLVTKVTNTNTIQYVNSRVTLEIEGSRLKFANDPNCRVFSSASSSTKENAQEIVRFKDDECIVLVMANLPVIDKKL